MSSALAVSSAYARSQAARIRGGAARDDDGRKMALGKFLRQYRFTEGAEFRLHGCGSYQNAQQWKLERVAGEAPPASARL